MKCWTQQALVGLNPEQIQRIAYNISHNIFQLSMHSSIIVLFALVDIGLTMSNPQFCPVIGSVNGLVNGQIVSMCDDKMDLGL